MLFFPTETLASFSNGLVRGTLNHPHFTAEESKDLERQVTAKVRGVTKTQHSDS